MRAVNFTIAVLLAGGVGLGTVAVLRPRPELITLPPRTLDLSDLAARQHAMDSLRQALDSMVALRTGHPVLPSALQIGEPSLIVCVPDSAGPRALRAALRRQFLEAVPAAARVAALYHFRVYVRSSAGLQVVGPGRVPLRGGRVNPDGFSYLLAAPDYPAVILRGVYGDSALADAVARYAVLIGVPQAAHRSS